MDRRVVDGSPCHRSSGASSRSRSRMDRRVTARPELLHACVLRWVDRTSTGHCVVRQFLRAGAQRFSSLQPPESRAPRGVLTRSRGWFAMSPRVWNLFTPTLCVGSIARARSPASYVPGLWRPPGGHHCVVLDHRSDELGHHVFDHCVDTVSRRASFARHHFRRPL